MDWSKYYLYKYKYKTLPSSVTLVERPVRAFAPRKGHPPMDTRPSGAGTLQLATPGKLGSTSSPAAPSSHQGLLLNNQLISFYCYLLLLLKPPGPMPPAQKEGEDGALPGLLPSSPPKHLQGLGPWPRTKQGGEDGTPGLYRPGVPSSPCSSTGFACLLF